MKHKLFFAVLTAVLFAIVQALLANSADTVAAEPKGVCETFTKNAKIITHSGQHPVRDFNNLVELPAKVIDGNTIIATGKSGNEFEVRFVGAVAPKTGEKGGTEATNFVKEQIKNAGGKVVMFHDGDRTGKDGREVRLVCVVNSRNELVCLDELLVRNGLAKAADGDYSSKPYFKQIKPEKKPNAPDLSKDKLSKPESKTHQFTTVSGKKYEREFVRFGKDDEGVERVYWKAPDGKLNSIKFESLSKESKDWVKEKSGEHNFPKYDLKNPAQSKPSKQPNTNSDDVIADLFAKHRSDVQVTGSGVVTKLLTDDNEGDKHQRFILKLTNGQTLLVAHNIDIAPRLDGLAVGNTVKFYGEYYYNTQGGGIHWTHRDPNGKHTDGWLNWNGKTYQ
jgi:hypothetical protein